MVIFLPKPIYFLCVPIPVLARNTGNSVGVANVQVVLKWTSSSFGKESMKGFVPPVLKPNLDLLMLNIGQGETFTDQLFSPERGWLRTLGVDTLVLRHSLCRVPMASRVHMLRRSAEFWSMGYNPK
ncbi:hypothetical protein Bca4012_062889 [Brassica carinata]